MRWITNPGRTAGLIYLLLVLAAPLRLIVIPSKLFVTGDAARTAANILSHEFLFRLGIVADVFCAVVLIFLTIAFYDLFRGVSKKLAVMVVLFGGVLPAAIDFFNVMNDAATLLLLKGAPFLSVFTEAQRYALGMLFMRMHTHEVFAAETLWGLWLLPLAALVYKADFFPRFARIGLGIWLTLNGFSYIAQSFVDLLLPRYQGLAEIVGFPLQLGEVALVLWLVIMGSTHVTAPAKSSQSSLSP